MYKFLVTNDDGIESIGLLTVVKSLSRQGEVYVVAPAEQQSAMSMALTFRESVNPVAAEVEGAVAAHVIDGTPADCVKWCLDFYKDQVEFDFIISGINLGYNMGTGQFYSGTVAAAREGALQGIPSIALSVEDHHAVNFTYICEMIPELLKMSKRLDPHTFLNVNTPNLPAWKIKGVKITQGAPHEYGDVYHFHPQDDGSYQMKVTITDLDESLDNDFNAIAAGYATITPFTPGSEDRAALRQLQGYATEEPICIFLDAQEKIAGDIRKRPRWEANITKWAKAINRLDMPALISEQHGWGHTVDGVRDRLHRSECVERKGFNAMDCKDFAKLIGSGIMKRVYIAGLETHISVQMTALELAAQGYDVHIIEDCCASKTTEDHQVAIDNMRAAGCTIATCESALMEILGGSDHPAFKSIRAIISEE
ncbi:MAG: 5'/3'-nucleotidase SurE [Clostridiales bacterium]|nr:5'/3'-nucleotidase SurE [Candidatus Crickella equi]